MARVMSVIENERLWGRRVKKDAPFAGVDLKSPTPKLTFFEVRSKKEKDSNYDTSLSYQTGICPKHSFHQDYAIYPRILVMDKDGEIVSTKVIPDEHLAYNFNREVLNSSNEFFSGYPETGQAARPPLLTTAVPRIIKMVRDHNTFLEAHRKPIDIVLNALHLGSKPWFESTDIKKIVENMTEVLRLVKPIFEAEPKIIKVQSPIYVFGDIHGNLKDLMTYTNHVLKKAPALHSTGNCLFLGDYVDRGSESMEVVLYLFCRKILQPNKIFLLRGNHEDRPIQINFSFKTEILRKLGGRKGINVDTANRIWELFNSVFDVMPIAAVIDESIFCAHGGIPYTQINLNILERSIPKVMRNMQEDNDSVWEILWSDPASDDLNREIQENLLSRDPETIEEANRGYVENSKRGTGYFYSERAVDRFMAENNLTHVIRAHEVVKHGFAVHFGGKCYTIFSSSHYQGLNNTSACIFIQDEKLRIIKLQTWWSS